MRNKLTHIASHHPICEYIKLHSNNTDINKDKVLQKLDVLFVENVFCNKENASLYNLTYQIAYISK